METLNSIVSRLRSQMSRGEPILFAGAGFSVGALNRAGNNIPTTPELAAKIWALAFPGQDFVPDETLGDVYHAAKRRNPKALLDLLRNELTVDSERLPDFYCTWFSMPWARCYTLNVDDLDLAIARKCAIGRSLRSVSATSGVRDGTSDADALEVVHLNGALSDDLDQLTFSPLDYATRATRPEEWYTKVSIEILSRPVVFVGTELRETTLWQYIEFRRGRGPRGTRELRPGSYLVCPDLNPARRILLDELNVDWLQMTAEQFAQTVLQDLTDEAAEGHRSIRARNLSEARRTGPQLVSELSSDATASPSPEYLVGQEPAWPDIREGLAAQRQCDEDVYTLASAILSSPDPCPPLLIAGTAGSGKSTSLMRLALRLAAEGVPTYWIDAHSSVETHRIRDLVAQTRGPLALLIDDADAFGRMMSGWALELTQIRAGVLLAAALRSSKIAGILDSETLGGIHPREVVMPPLTDSDIEALLALLDKHNRLGVLKGMSHDDRVTALRREAGRQLLVAMIQATSGRKLRQKVFDEFVELSDDQRKVYALICLAHSQRFDLGRDEILDATGNPDNTTLNALEALTQRHIITRKTPYSGYAARHRMIADELVQAMEFRPYIGPVLQGLSFAFATRVRPDLDRNSTPWRKLIRFINHDLLNRLVSLNDSRACYDQIEPLLHWDYQFWLQRGSLEVEYGDLDTAMNFLSQARSLAPGQRNVETEYAYLLTKKAAHNPDTPESHASFAEGRQILEDLIGSQGKQDPYPYHVLGSQGLAWARRARLPLLEKRALLGRLRELIAEGASHHPRADELGVLKRDIEHEWLSTAIPST